MEGQALHLGDTADVIDLTDEACPEGHPIGAEASFCPVCLTPVARQRAFWSVNQGKGAS